MGVPKIPAKIFIFEEILKGTFQLSVEHYFSFGVYDCTSPRCCFKHCSSYYSGFGMLSGTNSIYISTSCLQELKELGKHEYFFRILSQQ